MFIVLAPAVAMAASNGCDNERNSAISPELALCSTHVYNIGRLQNPDSETDRQFMRDVVALKTTAITQQMYAQYEYMASMMKQIKVQLERSVMNTRINAAGATAAATGGGAGTTTGTSDVPAGNRTSKTNQYIADAENCAMASDVIACLEGNASKMYSLYETNKYVANIEMRRQLKADIGLLKSNNYANADLGDEKDGCKSDINQSKFKECLEWHMGNIRKVKYAIEQQSRDRDNRR